MGADLLSPLTTRKVGVDMNLAGAWRTLGTFNLDECDIDGVLDAAETLVRNQAVGAKTGKLRVTDAQLDFKPVLMYWTEANGWEVSRHVR